MGPVTVPGADFPPRLSSQGMPRIHLSLLYSSLGLRAFTAKPDSFLCGSRDSNPGSRAYTALYPWSTSLTLRFPLAFGHPHTWFLIWCCASEKGKGRGWWEFLRLANPGESRQILGSERHQQRQIHSAVQNFTSCKTKQDWNRHALSSLLASRSFPGPGSSRNCLSS